MNVAQHAARSVDDKTGVKRILIVDDKQSYAQMLAGRLASAGDIGGAEVATDLPQAKAVCEKQPPDLVLLEIGVFGKSAFDVLQECREELHAVPFAVVSSFYSPFLVHRALKLNVRGFLLKRDPVEDVVDQLRDIVQGHLRFSTGVQPYVGGVRGAGQPGTQSQAATLDSLTPWQLKVLRHLVNGSSVKDVARKLHLSYKAIDSHKYRIMNKLGIHNRVELTRLAIREGLVPP